MQDRELLELAAKAIGLELKYNYLGGRDARQTWNPLEDDGDALRLAVKLRLCIDNAEDELRERIDVSVSNSTDLPGHVFVDEWHGKDACAATRRAIVRAAAEIGKNS